MVMFALRPTAGDAVPESFVPFHRMLEEMIKYKDAR